MSSEYSNRVWKAISDALGMVDQKSVSKRISTDPLVPVVSIPILPYSIVQCAVQDFPAAATASLFFPVVGPNNSPIPATLQRMALDNSQIDTLIMGWLFSADIVNVADPVNLKQITLTGLLSTPLGGGGSITQFALRQFGYFDFANQLTRVTFTSGPCMAPGPGGVKNIHNGIAPIWVPAGCSFGMRMETDPGVFNFQTTGQVTAQAWGVTFPKGSCGPFM